MKMKDIITSFVDPVIKTNQEAMDSLQNCFSRFPKSILEVDVDTKTSFKKGFVQDAKVFKIAHSAADDIVYVEYYENKAQTTPTLRLLVSRIHKQIMITASEKDKHFKITFTVENNQVKKFQQTDNGEKRKS